MLHCTLLQVRIVAKYGAMAASTALVGATVASGGLAGVLIPAVGAKLAKIAANPDCVQDYCQNLQHKLADKEEGKGLGAILIKVRKRNLLRHFVLKMITFTKTGSGQT
jgi:hypothetical protein